LGFSGPYQRFAAREIFAQGLGEPVFPGRRTGRVWGLGRHGQGCVNLEIGRTTLSPANAGSQYRRGGQPEMAINTDMQLMIDIINLLSDNH
jgi:hypothetical protein